MSESRQESGGLSAIVQAILGSMCSVTIEEPLTLVIRTGEDEVNRIDLATMMGSHAEVGNGQISVDVAKALSQLMPGAPEHVSDSTEGEALVEETGDRAARYQDGRIVLDVAGIVRALFGPEDEDTLESS